MKPQVETSSALKAIFTKNMDTVTAAGAHIRFCACSACACAVARWLLRFHGSRRIIGGMLPIFAGSNKGLGMHAADAGDNIAQ